MNRLKGTFGLLAVSICLVSCGEIASSSLDIQSSSSGVSSLESSQADSLFIDNASSDFDFDLMNDSEFAFDPSLGTFDGISGLNMADGDFAYDESSRKLTIDSLFLATLSSGKHRLSMIFDGEAYQTSFVVLDRNNGLRIPNGRFVTGNLKGYQARTTFKGEANLLAFTDDSVIHDDESDSFYLGRPSNLSSEAYGEKMGLMESLPFTIGGNGYVSFTMGSGKNNDLAYLSIVEEGGTELARFGNSRYSTFEPEQAFDYRFDLSEHLGKKARLVFSDLGSGQNDYLIFSNFESYHETIPDGDDALDIKPATPSLPYAPSSLDNGDFSNGMEGWTVSTSTGWTKDGAFLVDDGALKSNHGGDQATGLIRSSSFRVDGSGIVTLYLAAAQGSKYDKATFVSFREAGSNREVFRMANERHDGINYVKYFINLYAYLGKTLYLEIVDNGTGSYDTIFVKNIVTFYEKAPDTNGVGYGRNLNE